MIFSDLFFLYLFLPMCLIFYHFSKNQTYRNIVLLVFSLVFYAWGEPIFVLLLVFSAAVNFFLAKGVYRFREETKGKLLLALTLVYDIGILVLFKYTGFLVENINLLLKTAIPVPALSLPIGISFYTFEVVSYVLDCYWEKTEPEDSFFRFLLYVSLFPNVTAGPIVRYEQIRDSLRERSVSLTGFSDGISRIIAGLGKKVIIADTLGKVAEAFLGESVGTTSVLGCWYGIIIYSLQMYFDFSGYSDMAIGIAGLFGFTYPENFNYPFVSKTVAEFWQRWHISLGTFFRDYLLYVPIFGKQRRFGGLFLVWFCTGLWHGASWNFILWGLYFGVFILLETLLGKKRIKKIPLVIRHIYAKLVIAVGFGIFYETSAKGLVLLLKGLVGANGNVFSDMILANSIVNNVFLIPAALLLSTPVIPWLRKKITASEKGEILFGSLNVVFNLAVLVISTVILVNATDNPFLYFKNF